MPTVRRCRIAARLALVALLALARSPARADPPPVPPLNAEQAAAYEQAKALEAQVAELQARGQYTQALAPARRALEIRERLFGSEHPLLAAGLNNVAWLLQVLGAYGEARPLFERALVLNEKAFGPGHPRVATSLSNLGELLQALGSFAEARPLLERALAIDEQAFGPAAPEVAADLSNLAGLLCLEGLDAEALPFYERALAIDEARQGKDHPDVAADLNAIAVVLWKQGDYARARPLLDRALTIEEHALGGEDARVAATLNNLGVLLWFQGTWGEARRAFDRALEIRQRALGRDHPEVARLLRNLAGMLAAQGAFAEARGPLERAMAIVEGHVGAQLTALSAQQRLAFLRQTRALLDKWLRLAPHLGLSGYAEVLRYRGLVTRTETAERILARHADGPQRELLAALRGAQRRAAGLANAIPPAAQAEAHAAWERRYAEALAERRRLALDLQERSAPLRAALERAHVGLATIQGGLGQDEALVDLLKSGDGYLAFVVGRTGEAQRVDLGAARPIEQAARAFVAASRAEGVVPPESTRGIDVQPGPVGTGTQAWLDAGRALRALVLDPLLARLPPGTRTLHLVPDAALAAVPFAALPGGAPGTLLIDEYVLVHLSMAQDLVPRADAPPPGAGALLVGGVDYDHAQVAATAAPEPRDDPVVAVRDRAPRGERYTPLAQTRREVDGLRDRVGADAASVLVGAAATEEALRLGARGKRLLHVATHGFAREDLLQGLRAGASDGPVGSLEERRLLAAGHDPMLLSGLALAGANPRQGGGDDDGILTALEASYLDLDGVDLVTLSACETARGTPESGEGVLGLVSAFQMAGARTVLASLWQVDDEATRRLMDGLYERVLRRDDPLPVAQALREAARALRDERDAQGRRRFASPRFWAAFVTYGR